MAFQGQGKRSSLRPQEAARPQADTDSPIEVRGSPEERPSAFDFVLPGAFVPERNPAFAATWDGAMRVRDSTD